MNDEFDYPPSESESEEFVYPPSESESDDEPVLGSDLSTLRLLAYRLNRECIKAYRLKGGDNNEIYLLQFNDGPDCVARVPRNPTHPATKLACEVATMKYIAQNTKIRVPEVYDWDCSRHNVLRNPYILMERLAGQPLYRVWDKLTVENKKSVLSQIINVYFELWTKCQFNEIGCLYMNGDQSETAQEEALSHHDLTPMSFQIGPIVDPVFYDEGRDDIPSFTGPFRNLREWFDVLIQKEKSFFETHGVQKLIEEYLSLADAEARATRLAKQLALIQSKISENHPFESIDVSPFTLIHGDFDRQNILVEHSSVDNDIKIVGIIDWEFSRTGPLMDLCDYPVWIQKIEHEPIEVMHIYEQTNRENQVLRAHFRDEMIAIFGEKSGQILDLKDKDKRIVGLEVLLLNVYKSYFLERYLKCYIGHF